VRAVPVLGRVDSSIDCPTDLVGFAAWPLGMTTTGGAGGVTVQVATAAELELEAGQAGARIIAITALIPITAGEFIDVTSDKTIIGTTASAGITGGGIRVKDATNVIIRNLTFTKPHSPVDSITIDHSNHVWIDHCDLSSDLVSPVDFYDGLVDITHASDFVTVSWNRFHDHPRTTLVGHSATNTTEDPTHLTVTYHHNLFQRTQSYNPRVRFGSVHVFNNSFIDISMYAVASQMSASVVVERNFFRNVVLPITTVLEDPVEGTAVDRLNRYVMTGEPVIGVQTTWTPPYDYMGALDSTNSVEVVVDKCAGVGNM
jgi:pectate lyase